MDAEIGAAGAAANSRRDELREIAGEGVPLAIAPPIPALNHKGGEPDHVIRSRNSGSRAE